MARQSPCLTLDSWMYKCLYMKKSKTEVVKTSVELPRELWKAAHVRALDEHSDLRGVITAALELYLKTAKGKEERR